MYVLGQRLVTGANIRIVILDSTMDSLLEQLALRNTGKTSEQYWRNRIKPGVGLLTPVSARAAKPAEP